MADETRPTALAVDGERLLEAISATVAILGDVDFALAQMAAGVKPDRRKLLESRAWVGEHLKALRASLDVLRGAVVACPSSEVGTRAER